MFDPIVIRSKFGDIVEITALESGVKFRVAKPQLIVHPQKSSIEELRKKFPNKSDKELKEVQRLLETKAINIEARQPNLSPQFEPSFSLSWEEWEKLADILVALQPLE